MKLVLLRNLEKVYHSGGVCACVIFHLCVCVCVIHAILSVPQPARSAEVSFSDSISPPSLCRKESETEYNILSSAAQTR